MPSAAELAWLIPVLPLFGAVVVGLGLISFNRTVNRLRKPVALFLLTCVGAAAVLSFAVLLGQIGGTAPPMRCCFPGPVPGNSTSRWASGWIPSGL